MLHTFSARPGLLYATLYARIVAVAAAPSHAILHARQSTQITTVPVLQPSARVCIHAASAACDYAGLHTNRRSACSSSETSRAAAADADATWAADAGASELVVELGVAAGELLSGLADGEAGALACGLPRWQQRWETARWGMEGRSRSTRPTSHSTQTRKLQSTKYLIHRQIGVLRRSRARSIVPEGDLDGHKRWICNRPGANKWRTIWLYLRAGLALGALGVWIRAHRWVSTCTGICRAQCAWPTPCVVSSATLPAMQRQADRDRMVIQDTAVTQNAYTGDTRVSVGELRLQGVQHSGEPGAALLQGRWGGPGGPGGGRCDISFCFPISNPRCMKKSVHQQQAGCALCFALENSMFVWVTAAGCCSSALGQAPRRASAAKVLHIVRN